MTTVRFLVGAFSLTLAILVPSTLAFEESDKPTPELLSKIESLIGELGADEFEVRESAEVELSSMGLAAYESLLEVQRDKDIEVRLRARHIVDSMRGRFMTSGVSESAVVWLRDYHTRDKGGRLSTIESLSRLLPEAGADGLARIARFDEDERLSRLAAMEVISLGIEDDTEHQIIATSLLSGIGFSKRSAVKWLRVYAASIQGDKEALAEWQALIAAEQKRALQLEETDKHRNEYCIALRKIAADTANAAGDAAAAKDLQAVLVAQLKTNEDFLGWVDWLQDREQWAAIEEFAEAHDDAFQSDPRLLYGLAEAHKRLGTDKKANALAELALHHRDATPEDHAALAKQLKSSRGMYDWAESEYRMCIQSSEPTVATYYEGVVWLGELLHDLKRDEEAAELVEESIADMEFKKEDRRDKEKMRLFQSRLRAMNSVRSLNDMRARAAFFRACHYREMGDKDQELAALEKGISVAKDDVDLLIAMHTVNSPTAEWEKMTTGKIQAMNAQYRKQIQESFRTYEAVRENPDQREIMRQGLAQLHNQYAWLVGNTIGDADEAIRNSHKSLEFSPGDGGYLDTLGRCYYRAGRLQEALKYQQMAVERAPYELQIQRQLAMIQAAIENNKEQDQESDSNAAADEVPQDAETDDS